METVFNQSIWGDEGFSAVLSMKPFFQIFTIIAHDTSPPLWNIFEYIAFKIFGQNEIVIRSLSLSFYLVAIFFTFKLSRVFFSRKTSFLALILTALNPFFFTYAFEGRMYSILAAGIVGSTYFFVKTFFDEGSPKTRLGYIIMTLWALYSHHFAIFAIFLQGIWWLYELVFGRRKSAKRFFKAFLLVGLGYLPWLYPLYTQTRMVGGGFWLGTPDLTDLRNLIYEYLAEGIKDNSFTIPILAETYHHTALYLIITSLILRKWWRAKEKTLFLVLMFLGPILLTWFVSQKFQSIFFNRYLLYAIPPAMIVVASARSKLSFIPILTALLLFIMIDYRYFTHPKKLPFKSYSEIVKRELLPGDYLINWNSNGTHHIWETKFYGISAPIYSTNKDSDLPFFVGTALMGSDDIVSDIPAWTKRIGVITSGPTEEVKINGFKQDSIKSVDRLKFVILTPTTDSMKKEPSKTKL